MTNNTQALIVSTILVGSGLLVGYIAGQEVGMQRSVSKVNLLAKMVDTLGSIIIKDMENDNKKDEEA